MNLTIQSKSEDGKEILIINGEVDAFTAIRLKTALLELTEKEANKVVLDMSQVSYMDSTGIGVIIAGYKSAKKNQGSLIVKGLTSRVKRLFDITGLSEIVEVQHLEGRP
ncbi:STAS domain-containing protein [Pullulanibacillus sp. KACC 23026]|uniref:STAS domain-containing protein n=1 Tax=Pullulanibacillus sp. KACC 23026 TaxID=3028315 RepID=UPI0023AEDF9B|nr:STAS domain-containing protein [Pullulanibacillus sp. KACC 23026]WEG12523.1 STAS domain-containing protein [Pullulanibacillus sp. KACC 23026]